MIIGQRLTRTCLLWLSEEIMINKSFVALTLLYFLRSNKTQCTDQTPHIFIRKPCTRALWLNNIQYNDVNTKRILSTKLQSVCVRSTLMLTQSEFKYSMDFIWILDGCVYCVNFNEFVGLVVNGADCCAWGSGFDWHSGLMWAWWVINCVWV